MLQETTVRVPKVLIRLFLKAAEGMADKLHSAGCNDVSFPNTPINREAADLAAALSYDMTLHEFRAEYGAAQADGPLVVGDEVLLDAMVKLLAEALGDESKDSDGL